MDWNEFSLLLPALLLTLGTVAVLLVDIFGGDEAPRLLPPISIGSLIVAACATLLVIPRVAESSFVTLDGPTAVAAVTVLVAALATILMAQPSFEDTKEPHHGEFHALVLLGATAMHLLCMATELITIFIAIEMTSLCLYVLAGFRLTELRSQEAAFKYFMLAAFSGAFILMGIAFIYGATGSTYLPVVKDAAMNADVVYAPWMHLGLILMFVGFGFKLTFVPFHMYAPDVYAGAPLPAGSLIATGSKVAGFIALARILGATATAGMPALGLAALKLMLFVTLLSMIAGNFGALVQTNLKRLLAYSSIAHAGYLGLGFLALIHAGVIGDLTLLDRSWAAITYYLIAYTTMTALAFAVLAVLGEESVEKMELRGLSERSPLLAWGMAISMISLTGIPPTVGFFGKLQVFMVAVEAGFVWLAVLGVLLSVLSAYYYLHVIVVMFFMKPEDKVARVVPPLLVRFESTATPALLLGMFFVGACGFLMM